MQNVNATTDGENICRVYERIRIPPALLNSLTGYLNSGARIKTVKREVSGFRTFKKLNFGFFSLRTSSSSPVLVCANAARLFYSILTNFLSFPLITVDCNLQLFSSESWPLLKRTADGAYALAVKIVCRLNYCRSPAELKHGKNRKWNQRKRKEKGKRGKEVIFCSCRWWWWYLVRFTAINYIRFGGFPTRIDEGKGEKILFDQSDLEFNLD